MIVAKGENVSKDWTKEQLVRQAEAAKALVSQLDDDDAVLLHDMVEGETEFFEAVERCLDEMGECEIHVAGLSDHIKKMTDRKSRYKNRIDRLRGAIDQAFQMAEVKTHQFDCATVTTKAVPPKLIITDEAAIPSTFFTPQPPALDRKALLDAVKSGEVEGASLSNGGQSIQIRRA